jgi:hypothetical protein
VGVTPEAPRLDAVAGPDVAVTVIDREEIVATRRRLSTASGGRVGAVSFGAPHYSIDQLKELAEALRDKRVAVPTYVNTSRGAASAAQEAVALLEQSGTTIVTDTCTYITPIIDPGVGVVMTDSAKWAFYAPGNLGVEVLFGSGEQCVAAALSGRSHDPS